MNLDYEPDAIDVQIYELLVATADHADVEVDERVGDVLRLLREKLGMDVVFVSRFDDGRRTFLKVAQDPGAPLLTEGQSDPLEESWCQRVVDGRLPEFVPDARPYMAAGTVPTPPFPIGTHLSTPVPSADGSPMGTLCCFSFAQKPSTSASDIKRLRYAAQLLADRLKPAPGPSAREMQLQPMEPPRARR
jgi:hypothetical protein